MNQTYSEFGSEKKFNFGKNPKSREPANRMVLKDIDNFANDEDSRQLLKQISNRDNNQSMISSESFISHSEISKNERRGFRNKLAQKENQLRMNKQKQTFFNREVEEDSVKTIENNRRQYHIPEESFSELSANYDLEYRPRMNTSALGNVRSISRRKRSLNKKKVGFRTEESLVGENSVLSNQARLQVAPSLAQKTDEISVIENFGKNRGKRIVREKVVEEKRLEPRYVNYGSVGPQANIGQKKNIIVNNELKLEKEILFEKEINKGKSKILRFEQSEDTIPDFYNRKSNKPKSQLNKPILNQKDQYEKGFVSNVEEIKSRRRQSIENFLGNASCTDLDSLIENEESQPSYRKKSKQKIFSMYEDSLDEGDTSIEENLVRKKISRSSPKRNVLDTSYASYQGKSQLNRSVLSRPDSHLSNLSLAKEVAVGYYENFSESIRRNLLKIARNIDHEREILKKRDVLFEEGQEVPELDAYISRKDQMNFVMFCLVLFGVFYLFYSNSK